MIIILVLAIRLIILGIDIIAIFELIKNQKNIDKEIEKSDYKKINKEFDEQIKFNIKSTLLLFKPFYYAKLYNKLKQKNLLITYNKRVLEMLDSRGLIKKQIPMYDELRNRNEQFKNVDRHKAITTSEINTKIGVDYSEGMDKINPFAELNEVKLPVKKEIIYSMEEITIDDLLMEMVEALLDEKVSSNQREEINEKIKKIRSYKTEAVLKLTKSNKYEKEDKNAA
jgi:hypothetical protein